MLIKKNFNNGSYLIEIKNNNVEYNLKINDLCLATFKMLRKCDIDIWEKLVIFEDKKSKIINIYSNDEYGKINTDSSEEFNKNNESKEIDDNNSDEFNELNKKFRSLSI